MLHAPFKIYLRTYKRDRTGGSRSKVQEGAAYKVQEGSLYKVQSPFFREISQEVVACKVQSDFFLIFFFLFSKSYLIFFSNF